MNKFLVFCFFLTACAPRAHHTDVLQVTAELYPYVIRFEAEAEKQGHMIQIKDLIASGEVIAFCNQTPGDTPLIKIVDTAYWRNSTDAMKEHIMFHELGHCILNRGHTEAQKNYGPESVMYPYLFDDMTYISHHDEYMAELFHAS